MTWMPAKVLLLGWCIAALTACGGGGSDTPTVNANYFPLESGDRWVYEDAGKTNPSVVSTTGPDGVRGLSGTGVHSYDANDGTTDDSVVAASADGVRVYFKPGPANPIEGLTDGIELFRLPAKPGEGYMRAEQNAVDTGIDFDGDNINDQVSYRSVVTLVGSETLTTPAGTFADCLYVVAIDHITYQYSTGASAPAFETSTMYWYAPGVGLAKVFSTRTGTTPGIFRNLRVLVGYKAGTRSTDTVAPAVTTIAPAVGSTVGAGAQVQITFDETLYGESVNPALLRVFDSNGQAVAGAVVVEGTVLRFVNTLPWAPGAYTIELSAGVPDLLGNTSTQARSITFAVN